MAVTAGWEGRGRWGVAWAGAVEPEPPPSPRRAWLLSRAWSLAALSSSIPSRAPLLEGISHSLHPFLGFATGPFSQASHTREPALTQHSAKLGKGEGADGGAESRER